MDDEENKTKPTGLIIAVTVMGLFIFGVVTIIYNAFNGW